MSAPVHHLRRHRVGARSVKTFNDAGLMFPRRHRTGPRKGELDWAPLAHTAVLRILHNPRYAGVYCYGRHRDTPERDGTYIRQIKPREEWISFIPGAHPGYITWTNSRPTRRSPPTPPPTATTAHRPPREGPALLQGLIICGRCGRRMTVRYHARRRHQRARLRLPDDGIAARSPICQHLPGAILDAAVASLLLATLTPLAARSRAHRRSRTRAARRARRRAARRRRPARPARRRPGPPPLPGRRPRQPARRRHPRSRLEHRAARSWPTPRTPTTRAQTAATASSRRPEDPHPRAGHRPARASGTTRPPRARTQAHHPPAAHRRHRHPDQRHHHRARPLAGGQHRTLTLPVPPTAWELRQTPTTSSPRSTSCWTTTPTPRSPASSTPAACTSGEGRPFHPRSSSRNIRDDYGLRSRAAAAPRRRPAHPGRDGRPARRVHRHRQDWYHAGIVSGQRYNDKGQVLYHPPGPNPPGPATDNGRPAENRHRDLHEHQTSRPNRPEEVQYETRGLSRGFSALAGSTRQP